MSIHKSGDTTIDLRDMDRKLRRAMKRMSADSLGAVLSMGAAVVEREAKLNIKRHDLIDTGNLRGSIQQAVNVSRRQAVAYIGSAVEYAALHEYGGVITPQRAKVLTFKIDGKWVSAKRVNIKPRPYLRPALNDNRSRIMEVIGKMIAKQLEARRR